MISHIESGRRIPDALPRYGSLIEMLAAAVDEGGDRPALVCEDRQLSYRELGRAVTALAERLPGTGAGGGRVALMMPNGIEAVVASFAAMAAGAQLAPMNPFFTVRELRPVMEAADVACLVCVEATGGRAREAAGAIGLEQVLVIGPAEIDAAARDGALRLQERPMPAADDLALLVQTGGTTGTPKGVDLSHRALMYSAYLHCAMWPVTFGGERFLSVAPMFHIWGFGYATLVPIYARGTMVIVPKYDPEKVLQALADYQITVFGGGPAPIYAGLAGHPLIEALDFHALKYCLSGGAPCPADLHRRWKALTGCALYEGWGMSEGAPLCMNPGRGEHRLLSVGIPPPETEIEIVDLENGTRVLPIGEAGEVRVRGPQLMQAYRNRPEETAQALRGGWLYTGDIGYVDGDGFLFLVDRKKDMVIVGGYNVYPREIDELLFNHPKIREAATVGRPEERLGEVLVAFVVLCEGERMSEPEFFEYCRENLVKYKRPVEVHFVESLPRTGTNKIDKRLLRETARMPR